MNFLNGMAVLLMFQLLGELAVLTLGLAIPGPVLGMILLFVTLLGLRRVPAFLAFTSSGLLANLSLLFVPAGVGVITHWQRIGNEWLPILLTLLLSTLIGMAVTAWVMQWMMRRMRSKSA